MDAHILSNHFKMISQTQKLSGRYIFCDFLSLKILIFAQRIKDFEILSISSFIDDNLKSN